MLTNSTVKSEFERLTQIVLRLERRLQRIERKMDSALAEKEASVWLSARQTGKTKEQLRYLRQTQPERVKPMREGTRSYLYNITAK